MAFDRLQRHETRQIQQTVNLVDLVVLQRQRLADGFDQLCVGAGRDFQPDRLARAERPQALFDGLRQVLQNLVTVNVQIRIAGHPHHGPAQNG